MKKAEIRVDGVSAGVLIQHSSGFSFAYHADYSGPSVSLAMPFRSEAFEYEQFPPFFDGLLPEGVQLDALLRLAKIDRSDFLAQLVEVGADVVGNTSIHEIED